MDAPAQAHGSKKKIDARWEQRWESAAELREARERRRETLAHPPYGHRCAVCEEEVGPDHPLHRRDTGPPPLVE